MYTYWRSVFDDALHYITNDGVLIAQFVGITINNVKGANVNPT